MSTPIIPILSHNGFDITPDANGNISLTALWKSAGANAYKRPADWQREEGAAYLKQVCSDLKVGITHVLIKTRGRNGGTSAMPEVAVAYAKYLSTKLARLVNQVFLQRVEEEKNPDLIVDRAIATYERRGFTPERIVARLNAKSARVLFTGVLARHGVDGEGYKLATNAAYFPIFGGDASHVRQLVGVGPKDNPRDSMSITQLRIIELAETLAGESIESTGAFGNTACVYETNRAAQNVAQMVERHRAGGLI